MKAFFGNNYCNRAKALTVIDKDRVFHDKIEQRLVDLQPLEF
ncbi:hypothetical protein ES703_74148 [subsurface metagenome]